MDEEGIEDPEERRPRDRPDGDGYISESIQQIATTIVQLILLLLGITLVIFATGQAVGIDFLGLLDEVIQTEELQWILVAFFGLILIAVAIGGFRRRS